MLKNRTIEEWKKEEGSLIELKQVEELEIELIKKQKQIYSLYRWSII